MRIYYLCVMYVVDISLLYIQVACNCITVVITCVTCITVSPFLYTQVAGNVCNEHTATANANDYQYNRYS